ncbi:MAG: MFS transporter [Fimbriimonadaceae bacterium]|nr:MFS transporter [Fimbriimonadaceae bacterium]
MSRLKRLPKEVWKLGWISLFADVSTEMVYPLIPLFLTEVLKAPARALGLVEGVSESIVSILKGWSGLRSDKIGRRLPFVQTGYGLSAAGKPLLALAWAWPLVLVGRGVDRVGKGIRGTARDALLTDVTPSDLRGAAFGIHRAMDTAGALIGVLLAGLLLIWLPGQYRLIFLLAAIPGFAALYLTFRVKETNPPEIPADTSAKATLTAMPRGYWSALGLTVLFGLANSSDTFLLLRASKLGLSDVQVIWTYALYNVTYMLMAYPAGVLSDRIGRWWVMGAGWALYALVYAGFATQGVPWLVPLFALYGIYIGLTKGVSAALVADHAPKDRRGSAMGLFYFATGLATLAASALTGLLWDLASPQVALGTAGAMAAVAAIAVPIAAWVAKFGR